MNAATILQALARQLQHARKYIILSQGYFSGNEINAAIKHSTHLFHCCIYFILLHVRSWPISVCTHATKVSFTSSEKDNLSAWKSLKSR